MANSITGLSQTLANLQNASAMILQEIKTQVVTSSYKIHTDAVNAVAVDLASVKQSGSVEFTNQGLTGKVYFSAFHAGFLEFGTGTKVIIPTGWEAEANQFRGQSKGNWEDFKKLIQSWMGRKGIDLKYTHAIMLHIYRVGVSPKPFLIPAYQKEVPNFLQAIKTILAVNRTI
jgi:hypothetical protein